MKLINVKKSQIIKSVIVCLTLIGVLLISSCAPIAPPNATNIGLGQAITLSQNNNISEVKVEPDKGWIVMKAQVEGDPITIVDESGVTVNIIDGTQLFAYTGGMNASELKELGFIFPPDYSISQGSAGSGSGGGGIFSALFPFLLLGLLMFWLLRLGRGANRNQMGELGRSKAILRTGGTPGVTFADVAGVEEAKQDLQEVVEFLKNRLKFQRMGARVPKGVLLVGPPGTGKTLLAKAVAGEAGVPFFSISGSEFVEVFVGVGASRVRDLFQQAKARSPSIIFVDEIDAVGRRRSVGPGASHEEREQTLNQILSEMDGFNPNTGIIVLAATNRLDVLDPALLRPGRFDRRVTLDNPDASGRNAILAVHVKGKPLDAEVNLEVLAKQTAGFSGADLANLVNEAAIIAARKDKEKITMEEFNEAIDRVIAGPAKKNRKVNLLDKKRTAYHEGGHALVAHMLPEADPVFKVSIVARGGIGGYTRTLPEEEHFLMTKEQLQANLAMLLAGHTAEKMVFGNVSTGPHNDIKRATELARKMITDFGMSDKLSLRTFGGGDESIYGIEQKDYSEEVAWEIDKEVHALLNNAQEVAKSILLEYKDRLIYLAEKLIEVENLEGEELARVFNEPIPEKKSEEEVHKPSKRTEMESKAPAPGL